MAEKIDAIREAVAERFSVIKHTFTEKDGDFLYGGYRCAAEKLGWRFQQTVGESMHDDSFDPAEILAGKYDAGIERTWHCAASAEYWYKYEKRWD